LTSNHFFVPKALLVGDRAILQGPEHHHLSRVLRSRPGDEVWLFDEDGFRYRARVERLTGEEAFLAVLERAAPFAFGTRITLAQAVLKPKAMDWVVQKAAEFGTAAIVPVTSERVAASVEDGAGRKSGRWARIALQASKQSRTGRPPTIEPARKLTDFLASCEAPAKIVLCERGARLRQVLDEIASRAGGRPPSEAVILVGPEGGWSSLEEEGFTRHGFAPACLGRTTLRAETATLAALAIIVHDWNG
jgi:16S rRNA (uracil1498-N3)-methyltransferase